MLEKRCNSCHIKKIGKKKETEEKEERRKKSYLDDPVFYEIA